MEKTIRGEKWSKENIYIAIQDLTIDVNLFDDTI